MDFSDKTNNWLLARHDVLAEREQNGTATELEIDELDDIAIEFKRRDA